MRITLRLLRRFTSFCSPTPVQKCSAPTRSIGAYFGNGLLTIAAVFFGVFLLLPTEVIVRVAVAAGRAVWRWWQARNVNRGPS